MYQVLSFPCFANVTLSAYRVLFTLFLPSQIRWSISFLLFCSRRHIWIDHPRKLTHKNLGLGVKQTLAGKSQKAFYFSWTAFPFLLLNSPTVNRNLKMRVGKEWKQGLSQGGSVIAVKARLREMFARGIWRMSPHPVSAIFTNRFFVNTGSNCWQFKRLVFVCVSCRVWMRKYQNCNWRYFLWMTCCFCGKKCRGMIIRALAKWSCRNEQWTWVGLIAMSVWGHQRIFCRFRSDSQ